MNRKALPIIGVMLAALAAIGLAALVAWNQLAGTGHEQGVSRSGEALVAPGITVGGSFELINQDGEKVTQDSFPGQYMLIYFGYSSCPDVCPTELSSIAAAMDLVAEKKPAIAAQVTPVFITIDPARDTPAMMKDYVAAFHPRLVGLTGSEGAIADIARKFRVFYSKGTEIEGGFYLMNHSGYVYFMAPDGSFVTMFHGGSAPETMAEAITRYVSGKAE
ncbi:MAG: SCO family protein [Alphaproteobacteria bacterium]|nr:SCO family protein [Alphaproteobacteria bacterium]